MIMRSQFKSGYYSKVSIGLTSKVGLISEYGPHLVGTDDVSKDNKNYGSLCP